MYNSLRDCVNDLEKHQKLIRIKSEIDPNLEAAEIHRRVYDEKGPALLFENLTGSRFQGVSNVYGTIERTQFIFRKTLPKIKKVIQLKADPSAFFKSPLSFISAPFTALKALPLKARFSKPILFSQCQIEDIPQIKSWPMDGGAFVTLPQVCTLPPHSKKIMESNLGMYRIQLNGNNYVQNEEIGMHYQLHRGIGVHHTLYNESEEDFKCSIFVGGPPSHAFSAIMPMPEGLSEMTFAGMLANRRFRYFYQNGYVLSADADFCITGTISKNLKKAEGPFGDHLGYYSLAHPFPVMKVDKVYHRKNPLWHFTVVGRPPQEDSSFGYLIHELVEDLTPGEFPGLVEINAVDAAGVHPLLIAIGKERYMPFREQKPEEILTIANRILGSGQTSLAKFLIIAAEEKGSKNNTHDISAFLQHVLERVDWTRDLHFQTKTTIDTLDYSGSGWNAGSKVVIACCGPKLRELASSVPENLLLPVGFSSPKMAQNGILLIKSPEFTNYKQEESNIDKLTQYLEKIDAQKYPLIILVDDSEFTSASLNNFLWVTFTRANPSHDIYGVSAFTHFKHWGCKKSLIIDARIKAHHAPELITDKNVSKKADKLFSKGGELYSILKKVY